jgi:hypothetical protein
MDLNTVMELAGSRQPVFWAATGAIALGAAFLAAALVMLVRRARGVSVPTRIMPDQPVAEAATTPPTDVYQPSPPSLALSTQVGEAPSLALLLRRLQAAGDRLEEIAGDLETSASFAPDSPLKDTGQDVEYVFKASGS